MMKLEATEKKISAFCARRGLVYSWQECRYNTPRAVIVPNDREEHNAITSAAKRLKGVHVDTRTCYAGGVWESRVYMYDSEKYSAMMDAIQAEMERAENWNRVHHEALEAGKSPEEATREAEAAFPTPAA